MQTEKPRFKNGGVRPGAGRPAFAPTDAERKQVEQLAGYGLPYAQIATLLRDGISVDTLTAHCAQELAQGKARANAAVGESLFRRALNDESPAAAIWWSKTQLRWSEPAREVVVSGSIISISAALADATSRLALDPIDGECVDVPE